MKTYVAKKHSVIFGRLFYPGEEVEAESCPSEYFAPKVAEVPQVNDLDDDDALKKDDENVAADPIDKILDEVAPIDQLVKTVDEETPIIEPSDAITGEDLFKLTVKQLEELAAAKGIVLPSKANKGIIIGMLMQQQ